MNIEFKNIKEESKGQISVFIDNNEAGYIKYDILNNGNWKAISTLVYEEYKDNKLGMPLFEKLISYAEEENVKIFPVCPFIVKMFARKPELSYMLDETYKARL